MPAETEKPIDPLSQALDLGNRYGGISAIPSDELAALGYMHVGPGRIVPIGFIPEIATGPSTPEDKFDQRPFDVITVNLLSDGTFYKRVAGAELEKLSEEVEELTHLGISDMGGRDPIEREGFCYELLDYILPHQSPLFKLRHQLMSHLSQSYDDDDVMTIIYDIFYEASMYPTAWRSISDASAPDNFVIEYVDIENQAGDVLHPEQTENLVTALERFASQAGDVEEMEKMFSGANESEDRYIEERERMPSTDAPDTYLRTEELRLKLKAENGVNTGLKLLTYHFGNLLDAHGITSIAQSLRQAPTIRDAKELLDVAIADKGLFAHVREEVLAIRNALPNASASDRIALNQRRKFLEDSLKDSTQMLLGMNHFFDFPTHAAAGIRRKVKGIQSELVLKRDKQHITLSLDGRPSNDLDKDPGALSGDCTSGKPLPFAEKGVPVFNVKVYQDGKLTGSIYLLKTVGDISGKGIWHLDAIQIPSQGIAWDNSTVQAFVTALASEAVKKGVDKITVNETKNKISNYDYIEKGIREYIMQRTSRHTIVRVPKNPDPDIYTGFQGHGSALVLWRDKED